MAGDAQLQLEGFLGAYVTVGQQDWVGGLEYQLPRQLVDLKRGQLLDPAGLHFEHRQRLDGDAAVFHVGIYHFEPWHRGLGGAIEHDPLINQLDAEQAFHFPGELDIHVLQIALERDRVVADRGTTDAEDVHIRG